MEAQAEAAQRRRQELKEEAYYLVLKALILRDKPDMTLLARLRLELSIGTDSHKTWMQELMRQKQAGTLAMHVDDRPGIKQQTVAAAQPTLGATRSNTRQLVQQPSQQVMVQQHQQQPQQQGAARAKTKAKEEEHNELPSDPLHMKVQFYRVSDGWMEGVITEVNALTRKIKVNVLSTKKVEWLDYAPSPCLIVHANARVTDLTGYV